MNHPTNSSAKSILLTNAKIYTGAESADGVIERGEILIKAGKIKHVFQSKQQLPMDTQAKVIDLKGRHLAPGLIDIQINGGYQHYFSKDPTIESLLDMSNACKDFGTLHLLPTLISSPTELILRALKTVRDFKRKYPEAGVEGMHLEGPFFNPAKRGAHNASIIRQPTDKELELIVEAGSGIIKVMTIAPEMFRDDQIRYLLDQGIVLSAGHSDMRYEQAIHYFDLGINMVTHLYNAMSAFSSRSPGLTGAALERSDVWAPIILDGYHVHYGAARLAHQLKAQQLMLITDSSFLGRRMQSFSWNNFDAKMVAGTYRNKEGNLAGAAISMVEAMQNARRHLGLSNQQIVAMATSRPARAIQMHKQIGKITSGFPSRFAVFDEGFNNLEPLIFKSRH